MQPRFFVAFFVALLTIAGLFTDGQAFAQAPQTREEFVSEVRQNLEQKNYAALDAIAAKARVSRERFPGADWKLFVFYQALSWPASGAASPESEWKTHLSRLEAWTKQPAKSETARIAYASSLVEYAGRVYSAKDDWQGFGKHIGGKEYQERLRKAEEALGFDTKSYLGSIAKWVKRETTQQPKSELPSKCPHWYYTVMALQRGRPFNEWRKYEAAFTQGTYLEPKYFYLYQSRAFDLLPQNYGKEDRTGWLNFTEDAIKKFSDGQGGEDEDILYYLIVAFIQPRYVSNDGHGDFFRENPAILTEKVWRGYSKLEARYGTNKFRLNEIAQFAVKAQQYEAAKALFERIGNDWDERVWKDRTTFEGYRNIAKAKAPTPGTKLKSDLAELKATLSSRQTSYAKSEGVEIEAIVHYPAGAGEPNSAYEVSAAAFTLAIRGTGKSAKETLLFPQVDSSQATKRIEEGGSIRLTYKLNFALAAGEYKARLKSVNSNELTIKIGGAAKR